MKMYEIPQSIDKYLDIELECSCGRTHYVPIKSVLVEAGAINKLPFYVEKYGYKHPYIICDEITYKIAAKKCEELLEENKINYKTVVLKHLGFDEATLGEIVINMPIETDLMIAVGTGSITDMIRYTSYKLRLPCFTVATGAPMDGFAASIGIVNVNNLKATMQAHNSELIIGDTDILKTAPYRMTVAGFGDLIGKLTCINDWELARIINNEHYCGSIVKLVKNFVESVLNDSGRIKDREPSVLGDVMRGLVLSGAAISLYGDSRPASGAEHHMSHYWETVMEQRGEVHAMHGEQVAVGTVLVLMLAELLAKTKPDFEKARNFVRGFDKERWCEEIKRCYGSAAGEVFSIEEKAGKNNVASCLARIDSMEANWDKIALQLATLPSSAFLKSVLDDIGCPSTPAQIGIDADTLKDTFLYCKEVRPRYTIFQTVYDLGLMDEFSDIIINKLY